MTTRSAQRDVRHAVQELIAARTTLITELAARHTASRAARDGLDQAQHRVAQADTQYRQARDAALTAGWTNKELVGLGYPQSRLRRSAAPPAGDTPGPVPVRTASSDTGGSTPAAGPT